jgi:UDP-N-acetylglucosamine 2-epimerase (non-hydrolysing)
MTTFLACMGTRPEIIKMAVLHRLLKEQGHRVVLLHTGQHGAVADVLYRFFDMAPDIEIDLPRRTPRLADLTATLIDRIDAVVGEVKPDAVLVQGDTTSALAGAMAGYFHDIPVGHVEAGLRTGQRDPFPEEKNRELIGRLAHWHFPPTDQAQTNLLNEGIAPGRVFQVGNTVIDAAMWVRDRIQAGQVDVTRSNPPSLHDFLLRHSQQRLMLVTAHRRENWGQPIRDIAAAVAQLLAQHPDLVAVWPVHPNPSVQQDVAAGLEGISADARSRLCLTEPLDYLALISLLASCHFTLTDSGGIQEEASALARPVLVARDSTERQELVTAGGARLVGTQTGRIVAEVSNLLTNRLFYEAMQLTTSPFGDGQSARRIAGHLTSSA